MDSDDLTRAVVALPVAAIVPPFVPGLSGRVLRSLAAFVMALWAVGPALDGWEAWVLVALAVAASLSVGHVDGSGVRALLRAAALAVVLAVAAAFLLDASASEDALAQVFEDEAPAVVAAGGLLAVFVGGELIARLLAPYEARVRAARAPGDELTNAGRYIGWLERALLYAFVVAGASGAVALVVAAKSIARYPSFDKEKFGDYFLIGTLSSVAVAAGVAIAVRAILGLAPVLA